MRITTQTLNPINNFGVPNSLFGTPLWCSSHNASTRQCLADTLYTEAHDDSRPPREEVLKRHVNSLTGATGFSYE